MWLNSKNSDSNFLGLVFLDPKPNPKTTPFRQTQYFVRSKHIKRFYKPNCHSNITVNYQN